MKTQGIGDIVAIAKARRTELLAELKQLDAIVAMGVGRPDATAATKQRRGRWARDEASRERQSAAMKAAWQRRRTTPDAVSSEGQAPVDREALAV